MKVIIHSLLIGILLLPAYHACAESKAPAFTLPSLNGEVSLSDYRGKVVYLDFWASWCGPCRQSFPWMQQMQEKYRASGVEFIAINLDENRQDAEAFMQKQGVSFTIVFDPSGTTPKLYKIPGMPSSFIIGKDGMILFSHVGFVANSREAYEKHIVDAVNR